MTYKKLYEDALFKLEHNKITLGEFEEMIKPLDREIEQEPILDKIRAKIEQAAFDDVNGSKYIFVNRVNQIIDKYKAESEE
jgi:hypothetical protein